MWATLIGQIKHPIHFVCFQRNGWWIDPYVQRTVLLNQYLGIVGVGFLVQYP